jgi:hypothetical protein
VCGKEFELTAEEHYVAREDTQTGLRASLGGEESKLYDAMDCPYCGCQMLLNRRLRESCPCDYGICDECGEYEDEEEEMFKAVPNMEDMRVFLKGYCAGRDCKNCLLRNKPCGHNRTFFEMDEEEIRDMYNTVMGEC